VLLDLFKYTSVISYNDYPVAPGDKLPPHLRIACSLFTLVMD
jgi:hypothetical protein